MSASSVVRTTILLLHGSQINVMIQHLLIDKEAGFNDEQIKKIFGPIGIKLGGRSAPEIALSIVAQLVSEVYNK